MESWKDQAACKHLMHLFYPAKKVTNADIRRAAKVCEECPVQEQCYQYAQNSNQEYGIWSSVDFGANRKARKAQISLRYWQQKNPRNQNNETTL